MLLQQMKHIVQATDAKVFVDKSDIHTEFYATWWMLYKHYLGPGVKAIHAAKQAQTMGLERTIPLKLISSATRLIVRPC